MRRRSGWAPVEMQLHRGAGGFGGDVTEFFADVFAVGEVDVDQLATGFNYCIAQRPVAVLLGHPGRVGQELRCDGGECADHGHLHTSRCGGLANPGKTVVDAVFQALQAIVFHRQVWMVELNVVIADLRLEFPVEQIEHLTAAEGRLHG